MAHDYRGDSIELFPEPPVRYVLVFGCEPAVPGDVRVKNRSELAR